MDCIGSPTTNSVRPSPSSQLAVRVSIRSNCASDVSWNSSTRICRSDIPVRSAKSVGRPLSVNDSPVYGELGLQMDGGGSQDPRQCLNGGGITLIQCGSRKHCDLGKCLPQ